MKKIIFIWLTVICVSVIAVANELQTGPETLEDKYPLYRNLELLADVITIVQKSYVKEVSAHDLIHGAIRGVVNTLDAHSQFLEPDEYHDMKIETEGEFGGLGIEITLKDGFLTVVTPLEDTPAYQAGIKPEDRIIKIDGTSTEDITLNEAVKKLRGEPGTKVILTIMRKDKKEFLDFTIERSFIKLASIKDAQVIDNDIGYIRIVQFQENTLPDTKKAIEKLAPQCQSGIILDLRNNPGGLLQSAVDIASLFIAAPHLIVSTKGRLPDQNQEFISTEENTLTDLPLVIILNKGSASGSEIVAGAIKDWHRGILIGTQSFGKGSVQSVLPLRDGSALKLTTATYFTPRGTNINKIGIKPDIEIPISEEEEKALWEATAKRKKDNGDIDLKLDPQLQRAIDLLKGLYVFKETTADETANSEPVTAL